ncbi:MraZ protein [Nocardioides nitrophenolicus]|nr:MraZ protein [Nocardioides nitrophenolicus]
MGRLGVARMLFMGTYTPKLDDKGRLFLPAKFRDRLAEGLVVTQGQDKCLVVWPTDVFAEEAERQAARPMTNRAARRYARVLFAGGDESTPDKQGRIGIPAHLREYAGLERDVVVIGVRDRLEIWNPTAWREFQLEALEEFADLDEDDD